MEKTIHSYIYCFQGALGLGRSEMGLRCLMPRFGWLGFTYSSHGFPRIWRDVVFCDPGGIGPGFATVCPFLTKVASPWFSWLLLWMHNGYLGCLQASTTRAAQAGFSRVRSVRSARPGLAGFECLQSRFGLS